MRTPQSGLETSSKDVVMGVYRIPSPRGINCRECHETRYQTENKEKQRIETSFPETSCYELIGGLVIGVGGNRSSGFGSLTRFNLTT